MKSSTCINQKVSQKKGTKNDVQIKEEPVWSKISSKTVVYEV